MYIQGFCEKKEPGTAESVGSANSSKSGKSLGNKTDKTALGVSDIPLVCKKELKFTGQIGSPKDTSKLSFSSLAHQIEMPKRKIIQTKKFVKPPSGPLAQV